MARTYWKDNNGNIIPIYVGKKTPPPVSNTILQVREFGSLDTMCESKIIYGGVEVLPNLQYNDISPNRVYNNTFDNYFPYNQMLEETDSLGNVFIKIPKMYVKFYTDENSVVLGYDLSDTQIDETYLPHPAFYGKDYILFGKYQASSSDTTSVLKSISGESVRLSRTIVQYRKQASDNGDGYHQTGIFEWQLLQLLLSHYFGTTNSDNYFPDIAGSKSLTGTMNGILTGYDKTTGKNTFFGIENILKNGYHFLDGININNRINYINTDYTTWASDTTTNYTEVGASPLVDNYIKEFKIVNDTVYIPSNVSGGSSMTYFVDYYYQNTGWRVLYSGSYWYSDASVGVFYWFANRTSSSAPSYSGSRLMFSPI